MGIDIEVIGKLLAALITAISGFAMRWYFEVRPKLLTYLIHASAIPLGDDQGNNVNTHSIVVRNAGKKTANNIRIGHNFLPQFQIYPQLSHSVIRDASGSAEILVPTLVPNEQVTISYLYFPPLLWNQVHSYCKSDEMAAKYVNVVPTAQPTKLQLTMICTLLFIGATTIVYWLIYWGWNWAKLSG